MNEEVRNTIEHWAAARGHVDPPPPYDTGKGPRYAISDFQGWIYQCVRTYCGSIGFEMTLAEYDEAVEYVLHGVHAR